MKPYGDKRICKNITKKERWRGEGGVREREQQKETDETVKDSPLVGEEGGMKREG